MPAARPPVRFPVLGAGPEIQERSAGSIHGWAPLAAGVALRALGLDLAGRSLYAFLQPSGFPRSLVAAAVVLAALGVAALRGLVSVTPGEAVLLRLAGDYRGTTRRPGLWCVNPACRRTRVSTRIRNHETGMLKVNDADGNPIEIAAAVVWRVGDSARALLAVGDYREFVRVQAEACVRQVASGYPYDSRSDAPSLRGNPGEINRELTAEISGRVTAAGVTVVEARLTRLAYAPEIAQAMLRVQQANAVVAARHRIVEGAVGMVELALDRLSRDAVVELDEERKATMVGNLLVVLCSDRDPQPVVNSGSIY